jgi:hypothetical protein
VLTPPSVHYTNLGRLPGAVEDRLVVVVAAVGLTGPAWLLVLGFAAHGLKDAWQERAQYVSGTRWWPPFCAAIDWVVALAIAIEIFAGVNFR